VTSHWFEREPCHVRLNIMSHSFERESSILWARAYPIHVETNVTQDSKNRGKIYVRTNVTSHSRNTSVRTLLTLHKLFWVLQRKHISLSQRILSIHELTKKILRNLRIKSAYNKLISFYLTYAQNTS